MKYITLNDTIIKELQTIVKTDTRHRSRTRAQAFLLNAQGIKIPEIAKIINISQRTLYRWFDRFDGKNLNSVHELAGRGTYHPSVMIQQQTSFKRVELHLI